ncbi:hypothetical protein [Streptomyces sp. enrichment culture]|uniref:hypothetical protein n=1 Tax=Streptomyces sp. enrichment culture TaxID=1795815 RepID=UPI003F562144
MPSRRSGRRGTAVRPRRTGPGGSRPRPLAAPAGTAVVRRPFTAGLGDVAGEEVVVTVRARDPGSGPQARGKQAVRYADHDCHYTRVTGIWQTVWPEPVPEVHLRRPRITPDLAGSAFPLELPLSGDRPGHRVRAVLGDGEVSRAEARADLDLAQGDPFVDSHEDGTASSQPYRGQPYFVSEFGGIWWDPEAAAGQSGEDRTVSWGHGERVRDEEEFHARFGGLTDVLLGDRGMFGYCYTQLTDVFQERSGIHRFDRGPELDVGRVRAAQLRPAAIEEQDRT